MKLKLTEFLTMADDERSEMLIKKSGFQRIYYSKRDNKRQTEKTGMPGTGNNYMKALKKQQHHQFLLEERQESSYYCSVIVLKVFYFMIKRGRKDGRKEVWEIVQRERQTGTHMDQQSANQPPCQLSN